MPTTTTKRATIYLDAQLHRALRLQAAETDRTISDIVNDAVRAALSEDADDLAAISERASEPADALAARRRGTTPLTRFVRRSPSSRR